jgi:formate-dependent nitrite reductase membrane component NrfD
MLTLLQVTVNPHSGVGLAPHWGWYVILYFFLGGLAGGSYFIASLLQLAGAREDRAAIHLGYRLAFPLVIICGILLVIDLGKPLRFWHMLIMSERVPRPILKAWSPISLGSWILLIFGGFAFVSWVGEMVESGRISWRPVVRADRWARGLAAPLRTSWYVLGALSGLALAGYTGVLVGGTSIAVWHNARLLGALFLASAASTSYALLILLLMRDGHAHDHPTVRRLQGADRWAIVIELVLIALTLLWLGELARPFISGGFGATFWIGVVLVGLLLPLVVHTRAFRGVNAARLATVSAACVLVGGLLLRFVVVLSPQWPRVPLWYL